MTGVSGARLVVGTIVMGLVVPITIFFLLGLRSLTQLLTIAACTFLAWGVADLFARVLERPRLQDRSPKRAMEEEFDRRAKDGS